MSSLRSRGGAPLVVATLLVVALSAVFAAPGAMARSRSVGTIAGTVSINGVATRAVRVAAFATGQDPETTRPLVEGLSRRDGSFSLRVPPGQYVVMADPGDDGLQPAWWRGDQGRDITPVDVAPGGGASAVSLRVAGAPDFPSASGRMAVPAQPAGLAQLPVDAIQPYQGQTKCRKSARPGTVALRDLLLATYGTSVPGYLNRPCQSDTSEHYDGRAIDWMVDSRRADQAGWGDAFADWVTQTRDGELGAVARRLGIMYIIWRGRIWKQYQADAGWQVYSDCQRRPMRATANDNTCHRNHVHISLTPDGAALRTSWWRAAALQ